MVNLFEVGAAQKEQFKKLTLEDLAEKMAGAVKKPMSDWKQEKVETGTINGIPFARLRWQANDPRRQARMRGFVYVARDGDTLIQLTSQDLTPETDNARSRSPRRRCSVSRRSSTTSQFAPWSRATTVRVSAGEQGCCRAVHGNRRGKNVALRESPKALWSTLGRPFAQEVRRA